MQLASVEARVHKVQAEEDAELEKFSPSEWIEVAFAKHQHYLLRQQKKKKKRTCLTIKQYTQSWTSTQNQKETEEESEGEQGNE